MLLFLGQTKMVLIDSPTDLIATASRQIPQLDMKMERFGLAATGVRDSYMIEWREDIRPILQIYPMKIFIRKFFIPPQCAQILL